MVDAWNGKWTAIQMTHKIKANEQNDKASHCNLFSSSKWRVVIRRFVAKMHCDFSQKLILFSKTLVRHVPKDSKLSKGLSTVRPHTHTHTHTSAHLIVSQGRVFYLVFQFNIPASHFDRRDDNEHESCLSRIWKFHGWVISFTSCFECLVSGDNGNGNLWCIIHDSMPLSHTR